MKRSADKEKRVYKVWWGFLQHSYKYEVFCKIKEQLMDDLYVDHEQFDNQLLERLDEAMPLKDHGKPITGVTIHDMHSPREWGLKVHRRHKQDHGLLLHSPREWGLKGKFGWNNTGGI